MKKILVPTDFSECARAAENMGIEIAKKANGEIHFLHSINTPVDWVKIPLEKEQLYPETKAHIAHANKELDELLKRVEKMGLKAKKNLVYNKGPAEINHHIDQYGLDLIVMGSHGTKGFKEIIGSNTQKIVRYSQIPVLVIKKVPEKMDIENIIFASTFEEDIDKPLAKIVEFADLMKAKIHLLYVNVPYHFKETEEVESSMQAYKERCSVTGCSMNIYNALYEERGIEKFAQSTNADLIALTTHGRIGFMKMISHSIAENLANHSELPVLILNIHI